MEYIRLSEIFPAAQLEHYKQNMFIILNRTFFLMQEIVDNMSRIFEL